MGLYHLETGNASWIVGHFPGSSPTGVGEGTEQSVPHSLCAPLSAETEQVLSGEDAPSTGRSATLALTLLTTWGGNQLCLQRVHGLSA